MTIFTGYVELRAWHDPRGCILPISKTAFHYCAKQHKYWLVEVLCFYCCCFVKASMHSVFFGTCARMHQVRQVYPQWEGILFQHCCRINVVSWTWSSRFGCLKWTKHCRAQNMTHDWQTSNLLHYHPSNLHTLHVFEDVFSLGAQYYLQLVHRCTGAEGHLGTSLQSLVPDITPVFNTLKYILHVAWLKKEREGN